MEDEATFKTNVQYVKPEALDLGAAATIEGGISDCTTGNFALDDCKPFGFRAEDACDKGDAYNT